MKTYLERTLSVILALVACWIVYDMIFEAHLRNPASREALQSVYRGLEIGMPQAAVLSLYKTHETDRTTLTTNFFKETWRIGVPHEFGAKDPILYIQFDDHSRVSAIAMRTSDGMRLPPPPGFPDKGYFAKPTRAKVQDTH